jgi:RNA polymerase sigma-70 factor (ECF subfamily)
VIAGGGVAAVLPSLATRATRIDVELGSVERDEEIALMARVGEGDSQAYRALCDHFLPKIVAYAQRLLGSPAEAEDVAQETFLRLWTQASKWQPSARLSTWIFRIAHNLCVDRLRKRREVGGVEPERFSIGDRPSALMVRKQVADAVELALSGLPERQRAAIALSHYEGLTNPEIAEVLEVSVEAVESLLSRGRRSLRKDLAALHAHLQGQGR